jgi:hypothetical protein
MGHRMSVLDASQWCGLVGKLGKLHGAGRAAIVSRCYHAKLSGASDYTRLLAGLTQDEREDIEGWHIPTDVVLGSVCLKYEEAEKEQTVALDCMGDYCEPDQGAVTVGHLDFAWVVTNDDGSKWAYVADLKRSKWTKSYDPESLQLHSYGRAYALKNGCRGYVTGCWAAIEGEWRWSRDAYDLDTMTCQKLLDRIYFAATNESDVGTTGPACEECYSRLHCPEHLLPAALASTDLAPLCSGVIPSPEAGRKCLEMVKSMKDLAEAAEKQLKAMVKAGALRILDEDGRKAWVPVEMKGREKLDEKKLTEALGDLSPYKTRGAPFDQFRWLKVQEK